MVRRRLSPFVAMTVLLAGGMSCAKERDMPERMEMPDSMPIVQAIEDAEMRDSILDVMPGGEMVRGDSTAALRLLEAKR